MSFFSFSQKVNTANGTREIRVIPGDLCKSKEEYDITAVSAFRWDYKPFRGTLIGCLYFDKGISVDLLSSDPEIDLRNDKGVWLSKDTGTNLHRIACTEFLSYKMRHDEDYRKTLDISSLLMSLRMLIAWAHESGIPVRKIALPFLGTGNQSIEECFVAVPLFSNAVRLFDQIPELGRIDFYERRIEKAEYLMTALEKYCEPFLRTGNKPTPNSGRGGEYVPELFISYSSRQKDIAHRFRSNLESLGVSCWMAPDSIPHGSDYTYEIPRALGRIKNVLLLLSEEAANSRWVSLEISTGIGKNCRIFPCMLAPFVLNDKFKFLLGESEMRRAFGAEEITAVCRSLAEIIKD